MTIRDNEISIRRAMIGDSAAISACVNDAYQQYIPRMGQPPGPMLEDYDLAIAERKVFVAEAGNRIIGVLVLMETEEGFLLDNIAVKTGHQGKGVGRRLLELAEAQARSAGFTSIYLYTHEKMTENQALYSRIGYVEYARRTEKGLSRVYMRKQLPYNAV